MIVKTSDGWIVFDKQGKRLCPPQPSSKQAERYAANSTVKVDDGGSYGGKDTND